MLNNLKVLPTQFKPVDLNLPAKFSAFNDNQLIALDNLLQNNSKCLCLQAPCGFGKSLESAAYGRALGMIIEKSSVGKRTIYTCHQKNLQGQIIADFSHDLTGKEYAAKLKGRGNYTCLKNRQLSCNECTRERGNRWAKHCASCEYIDCVARNIKGDSITVGECPCVPKCEYMTAKAIAGNAEFAVLNLPYFLAEVNTQNSIFSGRPLVILDEGDKTEEALMEYIGVSIPTFILKRIGLKLPPLGNPINQKETAQWVWGALPAMESKIREVSNYKDPSSSDIRYLKELDRLLGKLNDFCSEDLDDWVVIPPDDKQDRPSVIWKPVHIKKHAEKCLWSHGAKFLLMSGTILSPKRLADDLGLNPNEMSYVEVNSTFPPNTRPIYYLPTADMTSKNINQKGEEAVWGAALKKLDEIIVSHPNVKGLVQSASYRLAEFIVKNSNNRERLITHKNAAEREHCIKTLLKSHEPLVIVSPSLDRGFDGKDDLCRFIVVIKIPYPNPEDPQISRRLKEEGGQVWYDHKTICTIIQETSRGNRHEHDFCEIYILDEQFGKLFNGTVDKKGNRHSGYRAIFPRYWTEALHQGEQYH